MTDIRGWEDGTAGLKWLKGGAWLYAHNMLHHAVVDSAYQLLTIIDWDDIVKFAKINALEISLGHSSTIQVLVSEFKHCG